ncbi:MAG: hypothetical protein KF724_10075 [Phycisphaeraceae bacterium]|nr:hypothetical protein [Phycisphaeraceae bacterium]
MSSLQSRASILAIASALAFLPMGWAQDSTTDAAGQTAAQSRTAMVVDQFLHHIMMARPDLAASAGEVLVADDITPSQLAEVVDSMNLGDKLDRAIRRGRAMSGGVAELVGRFETKLERGRLDRAREVERMREAIEMLSGTIRQQGLGRGRLEAAGEYAVPMLLAQIVDGRNPSVEIASTDVLVTIGRRSVLPLAMALPDLDPSSQRKVCDILGQIGWPTAVPFLLEVYEQPTAPSDVREAASRGISRLGGTSVGVSDAFTSLARQFFRRDLPLIPYPDEPVNNIWVWDSYGGLTPTPVPTQIFADVMAMRLAERALRTNPANTEALAIFVAANLRRQQDLAEGTVDPVYGDLDRSPEFFATVVGSSVGQRVLSLALDVQDTALVRQAIGALAHTGGAAVVTGAQGRTPIIECLSYPDRRVQYDAAILLGAALPTTNFSQDTAVVPLLAAAARTAGSQYAAVVAPEEEDRRQMAAALAEEGFTVVGTAGTWDDLVASALVGGMLDLVAARGRSDQLQATVSGVRRNASTTAAPVLLIVAEEDRPGVERLFALDRRVGVWTAGTPQETMISTITDLVKRTSGGLMDQGEAIEYAMRSLEVLQDIALSRNPVLRIEDGERALAEALVSRSGALRLAVANVMALIPTDSAQIKLLDVALLASSDEQAELLEAVAASGRRNGNRAEPRQIAALRQLVQTSSGTTADASAIAYGALGLPAEEAVKLILK